MQNPLDTLRQKSESGDRRAVSPVIGVILMVAITVILAAVIATFVLGLGENIGSSPTAGVTVEDANTSEVTATLTNLGSADRIEFVLDDGSTVTANLTRVGQSETFGSDGDNTAGNYSVVAVSGEDRSVLQRFTARNASG